MQKEKQGSEGVEELRRCKNHEGRKMSKMHLESKTIEKWEMREGIFLSRGEKWASRHTRSNYA